MNNVTIAGVPATITRTNYLDAIRALGIDPAELHEMTWGWNTITASVYALNEHGKRYADRTTMEPAMHHIVIHITDEPTPCPYCTLPDEWDACPIHRDGNG